MYKAIVFAGTTEGYEICRFLSANKISALACVATEYGSHSLEAGDYLKIQAKRLDEQEMTELFHKELPEFILDATHPYATEVTKNIKKCGTCIRHFVYTCLKSRKSVAECCLCRNSRTGGRIPSRQRGKNFSYDRK